MTRLPLLLICFTSGLVLAAEEGSWPVPNGDFEEAAADGFPANWSYGSHDGGDYSFELDHEDGNRFLRIVGKQPEGRAYWSQVVGARKAPRAFRVNLRYRGTTSQMDGFVRLCDAANTHAELSIHHWSVRPNCAQWTTFQHEFAVPAKAREATGVRAQIIVYGRGVGTVDYDDVSLEPLETFHSTWPDGVDPLAMPFRPHHKMTCQQNPPDFSWPAVDGSDGYHLQVARATSFASVEHEATDLADNFHNFPKSFEPGLWHWRVRFRVDDHWSQWTAPRRFRVDPDAWLFPVPSIDELLRRVPREHPRVWATQKTLADFRSRAEGPRRKWFADIDARVRRELDRPPPPEPVFNAKRDGAITAEWQAAHNKLRGAGEGAAERVRRTAFVYVVTGDEDIGRSAVAQLLNLAKWDPDGATSYATHDQVHRAITWKSAIAYDWCRDLLTFDQRKQVIDMVRTRTQTMFDQLAASRSLKTHPYQSHGWTAFGYMGVVAIALLHDEPEAERWFREIVPTYVNLLAPWGDEDGGWCQGTAYWQYSQGSNKVFMDALLHATGLSLYEKAFSRNSGLFPLYTLPHGSPRGHFGDGNRHVPSGYHTYHYGRLAQIFGDPVLQWARDVVAAAPGGGLNMYFSCDDDLPARPPVELPRARWFRDIDWVCMHSDLIDPERISFYFKSSPIGSFNHSHADQNSFVLNAFGEALAIDSGYYDWYGSPHDKTYTRQTLAHNAITHDGGLGQPIFDVTAKGKITGFVTHPAMDACTGDATAAYHGALGRAVRHVIYLRPDTFVLVDDLAAKKGQASSFEWWLHGLTPGNVKLAEPGIAEATVQQGEARLHVRLHHPPALTAKQHSEFIGPPNAYPAGKNPEPVRPQGRGANWPDQMHAWFATPTLAATKIIATLQPYRASKQPSAIGYQQSENLAVLSFESGARVFVRLGDEGQVTAGDVMFDGTAAASVSESVLLVEGTSLARSGTTLLQAEAPVTVVLGAGEACVSCADDTIVRLRAPGTNQMRDHRNRDVPRETWSAEGDMVKVSLEPGSHTLRFNDTTRGHGNLRGRRAQTEQPRNRTKGD